MILAEGIDSVVEPLLRKTTRNRNEPFQGTYSLEAYKRFIYHCC